MALVHMDDFNGYGTVTDLLLAGAYAGTVAPGVISAGAELFLVLDPDGVSPGRVLQAGPNGQNDDLCLRYVFPTGDTTTVGVAMRVWFPQLPVAGSNAVIALMDSGNNYTYLLCVTGTGRLEIRSGYYGPVLYTSIAPVMTAQGWWHIEIKARNLVAGELRVRVEGVDVPGLQLTGNFSGTPAFAQVGIMQAGGLGGATHLFYVKDYVIWNGAGPDVNDWVGTSLIFAHTIYADFALNWTPVGSANGFSILNSNPPTPAQYIFAGKAPIPNPYRGRLNALPADITSVKAVAVRYMAGKNDGGDGTIRSAMVADANVAPVVGLGPDRVITVAPIFYEDIYHRNPKTNSAWLPSDFNNGSTLVQLNRTT